MIKQFIKDWKRWNKFEKAYIKFSALFFPPMPLLMATQLSKVKSNIEGVVVMLFFIGFNIWIAKLMWKGMSVREALWFLETGQLDKLDKIKLDLIDNYQKNNKKELFNFKKVKV